MIFVRISILLFFMSSLPDSNSGLFSGCPLAGRRPSGGGWRVDTLGGRQTWLITAWGEGGFGEFYSLKVLGSSFKKRRKYFKQCALEIYGKRLSCLKRFYFCLYFLFNLWLFSYYLFRLLSFKLPIVLQNRKKRSIKANNCWNCLCYTTLHYTVAVYFPPFIHESMANW